jgi:hypothetical protein
VPELVGQMGVKKLWVGGIRPSKKTVKNHP